MGHENSETRYNPKTKRWENVYGTGKKKGKRLKPIYPYEKKDYADEPSASTAARGRSTDYGARGRPSPPGGFANPFRKLRKR